MPPSEDKALILAAGCLITALGLGAFLLDAYWVNIFFLWTHSNPLAAPLPPPVQPVPVALHRWVALSHLSWKVLPLLSILGLPILALLTVLGWWLIMLALRRPAPAPTASGRSAGVGP